MDRLDHLISNIDTDRFGEIAELLIELKQRRDSDLRPADKFLGSSMSQQWFHVTTEYREIEHELVKYLRQKDFNNIRAEQSKLNTVEELIDLQMSCETMLAILGLDEEQRREARIKVIEKNEARGYYLKGEE